MFDIVTTNMIHCLCGTVNVTALCIGNGKCTKRFQFFYTWKRCCCYKFGCTFWEYITSLFDGTDSCITRINYPKNHTNWVYQSMQPTRYFLTIRKYINVYWCTTIFQIEQTVNKLETTKTRHSSLRIRRHIYGKYLKTIIYRPSNATQMFLLALIVGKPTWTDVFSILANKYKWKNIPIIS